MISNRKRHQYFEYLSSKCTIYGDKESGYGWSVSSFKTNRSQSGNERLHVDAIDAAKKAAEEIAKDENNYLDTLMRPL